MEFHWCKLRTEISVYQFGTPFENVFHVFWGELFRKTDMDWSRCFSETSIVYCSRKKKTYEPRHVKTNKVTMRPAKTQFSLGIRPVWSESSLSAWRKLRPLATQWAHSEDSDQTGRIPRPIWVFAGHTVSLLVLSCRGSYGVKYVGWQKQKRLINMSILYFDIISLLKGQLKAFPILDKVDKNHHIGQCTGNSKMTAWSCLSYYFPRIFCQSWNLSVSSCSCRKPAILSIPSASAWLNVASWKHFPDIIIVSSESQILLITGVKLIIMWQSNETGGTVLSENFFSFIKYACGYNMPRFGF